MRLSQMFLFLAVAAGCSSPEADVPAEVPESAEHGPEPARQIVYSCESGRQIRASYPTDSTAIVEYEGRTLPMTVAVSGSGARYVGDELEWWTKGAGPGSSAMLIRHRSDDTSGEIVEECEQPT